MSGNLAKQMDDKCKVTTKNEATKETRRRLSMAASSNSQSYSLDGVGGAVKADESKEEPAETGGAIARHATLGKVGFVPGNSSKVNQDRAAIVWPYRGDKEQSFWGVFDGHGSLGHEVSTFVARELPKSCQKHLDKDKTVAKALHDGFVECNRNVCQGSVDCTFSGTTVIVCYIKGDTLYSANAGDSRACLAKLNDGKYTAVDLSDDQKPERADEAKRIIAKGGRVQACKGMRGEDIGPQRVWMKNQDVPGLAMTRSFGDLIAASVGVIPEPEVWERKIEKDDAFMIMASDGVWEFITNQEAVDIVAACKTPEAAVKALTDEATERWQAEEDVIDDITAVIAYFK